VNRATKREMMGPLMNKGRYGSSRGLIWGTRGATKVMPPIILLRKCNCKNSEIYLDDSHFFSVIIKLFFHKVFLIFNTLLPTLSKDAVYQCCKTPCLYFGAAHEPYKEALKKLRQWICGVLPNRRMQHVLLLHDNAQPHTSLRTRVRQSQKWDWLFFPILLTAQISHPATVTCLAL
jgi:hypothetical protein